MKPTNEPHTADTLTDILEQCGKENGQEHRANTAALCAAQDDAVAQAKIKAEIGVRKFAAAAAAAAAITEVSANNHALP